MLNQVLDHLQAGQGTLKLDELARQLNIEASALQGMIDFWVSRGRIGLAGDGAVGAACGTGCGPSCAAASQCPFVGKMPKIYQVK